MDVASFLFFLKEQVQMDDREVVLQRVLGTHIHVDACSLALLVELEDKPIGLNETEESDRIVIDYTAVNSLNFITPLKDGTIHFNLNVKSGDFQDECGAFENDDVANSNMGIVGFGSFTVERNLHRAQRLFYVMNNFEYVHVFCREYFY
jgi:hypothetical protein